MEVHRHDLKHFDILTYEGTDLPTRRGKRSPDLSFQLSGDTQARVMVEIGYSGDRHELKRCVIDYGERGANMVIVFNLGSESPSKLDKAGETPAYWIYRRTERFDGEKRTLSIPAIDEQGTDFTNSLDGSLDLRQCIPRSTMEPAQETKDGEEISPSDDEGQPSH